MDINSIQGKPAPLALLPAVPAEQAVEQRQLIRAVQALNATEMFGSERELSFRMDPQTKRPVIRIVDRKTKEVVQEIPGEYVLRVAREVVS